MSLWAGTLRCGVPFELPISPFGSLKIESGRPQRSVPAMRSVKRSVYFLVVFHF